MREQKLSGQLLSLFDLFSIRYFYCLCKPHDQQKYLNFILERMYINNKDFIENILKNEGLPPGARVGEAPAGIGNSGSATYSFEPNLTPPKENE